MDVLTPTVPEQQWHPNYRALMMPGLTDAERAVIADWADGFVDRDGKFAKEFQTTFNSSFWELYLHAAFRQLGCKFDFSHNRPDFVLALPTSQDVIAEAVIGSHPQGYRPEWDRPVDSYGDFDREDVLQPTFRKSDL